MKDFPDPTHYIDQALDQAARRYAEGVRHAGLKPTETLTRALARRATQEARERYLREMNDTFAHNISVILQEQTKRTRQIKQAERKAAVLLCPLVALVFGALAWFAFRQGAGVLGIVYSVGALAFLALLLWTLF